MIGEDGDTAFPVPSTRQSPLQVAGAVRPKVAEAFSVPQFSRSIEERREVKKLPKASPPVPSRAQFLQELSAPTTMQAL